jgi:hypothetical protein
VSHAGARCWRTSPTSQGCRRRCRCGRRVCSGGVGARPRRVVRHLAVMLADGGECVPDLGAVRDPQALVDPVAFELILIGDKNFRGKDFETGLAALEATIMRPRRKNENGHRLQLAPIRQRIESIFQTCKDILTLERHGAHTLSNLRVRLCPRFAALAAAVMLNHQLGRPSRSLAF